MMTGWAVLMVEEFRVVLGRGNALVVREREKKGLIRILKTEI